MKRDLKKLKTEELDALLNALDQPPWRREEILRWIYRKGVGSFQEMTSLPLSLRREMERDYSLFRPASMRLDRADDGTEKHLLAMEDGALCETVLIPQGEGDHRFTQCSHPD